MQKKNRFLKFPYEWEKGMKKKKWRRTSTLCPSCHSSVDGFNWRLENKAVGKQSATISLKLSKKKIQKCVVKKKKNFISAWVLKNCATYSVQIMKNLFEKYTPRKILHKVKKSLFIQEVKYLFELTSQKLFHKIIGHLIGFDLSKIQSHKH